MKPLEDDSFPFVDYMDLISALCKVHAHALCFISYFPGVCWTVSIWTILNLSGTSKYIYYQEPQHGQTLAQTCTWYAIR